MIQNMDFKRMFVKNNSQTGNQGAVDAMIKAIMTDQKFAEVKKCFFTAPAPASSYTSPASSYTSPVA